MPSDLVLPGEFVDSRFLDGQEFAVDLAHAGQGNWRAFRALDLDLASVQAIARGWADELRGVDRPWLCWNVDGDWSLVQQRLVQSVGWTPVVGFDPRVGAPPRLVHGAILVDFNRHLKLPVLYPHFPLEFAFLFCDRIAFWHSDLLIRKPQLRALAEQFAGLEDGKTAATWVSPGRRHMFSHRMKRYWELVGCTTRAASRDQFEKGCGWWMDYWAHPNQRNGDWLKSRYYWDHGAGVYYWEKREGGRCVSIDGRPLEEGHFTKIGNKAYKRYREATSMSDARRHMSAEIKRYFDLYKACEFLDLGEFLPEATGE